MQRSTKTYYRTHLSNLFFTFIILICLTPGCTNKDNAKSNWLVVALEAAPSSLDPRYTTDANGQRLTQLLFSSLVKLSPDLKIVPDAAKSWTYKDLTYSFILNKNITFSNGRPLTKDDILYTFAQYQSDKSPFQTNYKMIKKVEVDGSNSEGLVVTLKLTEYNALLLTDLILLRFLPKAETEAAGDNFTKYPVGTGSYTLTKNENGSLYFEARKNHAFEAPKIDGIEIKIIADDNTRFLKTLKGEIDLVQNALPTNKIQELENQKDLIVYKYSGPSMNYLLLNLREPFLKNLSSRQALSSAINREEIIKYKLSGLATPATSILDPGNIFHDSSLKLPAFDLEKAKELAKTAKLAGAELTLKCSNVQEVIEVAKVIANQLEQVGVKINIQSYEWGTFFGDVKAGNFQIALMRWVGIIDPDIYRLAFHSKELPPGRNRGYYSNPLLDQLLDRGISIENESKRIDHYKNIQKIVFEDLPSIPLWYPTYVAVVRSRVQNYIPSQSGDFAGLTKVTLKQ